MPARAKRRRLNGARRRKAMRKVAANERWMHLPAANVSVRATLQTCWRWSQIACAYSTMMTVLSLVAQGQANMNANMDADAINALVANAALVTASFASFMHMWMQMDHILHDITPEEEAQPMSYTAAKHPRIDDLSDPQGKKMTGFCHSQLKRLYRLFDLEGYLTSIGETHVPIYTNFVNQRGLPLRYMIHPEEMFLFLLCKIRTGRTNQSLVDQYFGQDYSRWGFAYIWMLRYLDSRYADIIGYQGLCRYLQHFPRFNEAIEDFVTRDFNRENPDATWDSVPGLRFLPFDIFGWIDDSIDPTCTPFSGPRGDYAGAARREEYAEAQRAVYTGYKKLHGIKVETVFLPNGLTFMFGPVSARQSDVGVLKMSNLDAFLCFIQRGIFSILLDGQRVPVFYAVFGDGTFAMNLQCVQSYYRRFSAAVQLTADQLRVNYFLKRARETIEKSYAAIGNEFHICDVKKGMKLAKRNPHAIEQLRVCHLMLNCKACFNGDTASSTNTFGVCPPQVEDYLAL